jgi:hypothetical protein
MSTQRNLMLSSLAVSVSAATLLGVSDMAEADTQGCNVSDPCFLAWVPVYWYTGWGGGWLPYE